MHIKTAVLTLLGHAEDKHPSHFHSKKWEGCLSSAWPKSVKTAVLICTKAAIQQQQRAQPYRYGPTLTTVYVHRMQGGAGQELPFLPSSEAAPPRNIKYEFGMKNEDYHNRCPSYHLLTKPPGCNLIR